MADRPEGELFSQLYLERGAPGQDSARMRNRVAALVLKHNPDGLYEKIKLRLGIDVPVGYNHIPWGEFFVGADLRDVLDTITLIYESLVPGDRRFAAGDAPRFVTTMNQIFHEENLHYEVDPRGGVHLSVDKEFERSRASIIAGLGNDRYVNVAHNFETAHQRLTAIPSDGKGAVRAVFDAAEALFRLMFPKEPRLTADAARNNLRPIIQRLYAGNPPATAAASKEVDAFSDWVDACHNYRHEHGREEVLEPPMGLAVQMVSGGASYIRWLAHLDSTAKE